MAQRSGWEVRVKINTTLYAVRRYSMDDSVPDVDVTNSEGVPGDAANVTNAPGYASVIPGPKKCRVMLQAATFDNANNPYDIPIVIRRGQYYNVTIFPAGLAFPDVVHTARIMVTNIRLEGDVNSDQPVTIEGVSDGTYTMADE